MPSSQDRVEAALAILEEVQMNSTEPPAAVVMPPDSGDFIIANADGFVHLAVASLKAAKGEKQIFKNYPWWVNYELDWAIAGLRPDSSAHTYLSSRNTKVRLIWKSVGICAAVLAFVCFVVGAVSTVRWMMSLFG